MNYIKKTLLPFIILGAFIPYGISQNENIEKKKTSIKPYYNVEANFGVSTCNEMEANNNTIEAKLAYQTLVCGASFSGGIELAHYFKVGLGLGYFYYKQNDKRYPYGIAYLPNSMTTHGIPLFLYLRSDFLNKKISPYLDFKIGNNFLVTKETLDRITSFNPFTGIFETTKVPGDFKLKNGLFLSSNIGVAFKTSSIATINVSVGYRYISRNYDMPYSIVAISDNPKYAKTGNVTVDHQFLVSAGVSF